MENGSDGVSKTATASAQAKSEIEEYLDVSEQSHKLFPRAVAVGLVAGAVAVLFRALLAGGDALRNGLVNWSHSMPALGWISPLLFGAVGSVTAVWLVLRYTPETGGSGIPHLKAVLVRELGLPAGCILVRCALDHREQVVTANTRLEPHMKLTAVIAPEADDALELLRRGCTSTAQSWAP